MRQKQYINKNEKAIIIIHEIYGINQYITDLYNYYSANEFDVYCPYLISKDITFDYSNSEEAYSNFINTIGFEVYEEINELIKELKLKYQKVVLLGSSVGATIAWRCTSNSPCDGMIGYYGSRIRDFMNINPKCPALLFFAKEDSFNVNDVAEKLRCKSNVSLEILDGKHGFADCYSKHYNLESCQVANRLTKEFLAKIL